MRRQSLRQYLWKWTEVVWTLFSPADSPPLRADYIYSIAYLAVSIWGYLSPRTFSTSLPRIRRPPLSFRPLFSPSIPSLFSRTLSTSTSFPPTTIFLLSLSHVRAKSTRAAAAAVCPPNYAEFISYGARHACRQPLPITFIPAVIYENAPHIPWNPPWLPFSRDLVETLFFVRSSATFLYESIVYVSSLLIDRAAARVCSTRRIEEIARYFK